MSWFSVTVQVVAVALSQPPQKTGPLLETSVTTAPVANAAAQSRELSAETFEQFSPGGLLWTLTVSIEGWQTSPAKQWPRTSTVNVFVVTNEAVTVLAASIVTVHVPVPLQAPLQPENANPVPADWVSVTALPAAN